MSLSLGIRCLFRAGKTVFPERGKGLVPLRPLQPSCYICNLKEPQNNSEVSGDCQRKLLGDCQRKLLGDCQRSVEATPRLLLACYLDSNSSDRPIRDHSIKRYERLESTSIYNAKISGLLVFSFFFVL